MAGAGGGCFKRDLNTLSIEVPHTIVVLQGF